MLLADAVSFTSDGGVSLQASGLTLLKWLGVLGLAAWVAWSKRDAIKTFVARAKAKAKTPADAAKLQETGDYHAALNAFDLVIRETLAQGQDAEHLFEQRAMYQTRYWETCLSKKSPTASK